MTTALSNKSRSGIDAARGVVYRSALLLDAGRAEEWLDSLCAATFHYTIITYSPEIRAEQEWFAADREELVELLRLLPRHNSDHGPLFRHVSVYTVDVDGDGEQETARAVSSVVSYQTLLDGQNSHLNSGTTRLLCTGKYYDRIDLDGGRPVLQPQPSPRYASARDGVACHPLTIEGAGCPGTRGARWRTWLTGSEAGLGRRASTFCSCAAARMSSPVRRYRRISKRCWKTPGSVTTAS